MVDERVTDGRRIAQLLASELTGLETGPLSDVAVVDAEPDVTPTPAGSRAYDVAYRGTRVGSVVVFPARANLRLEGDPATLPAVSVPVETDDGVVFRVESGAAVKRTVDALRETLRRRG